MWNTARIFVAEPDGMMGRAISGALECRGSDVQILDGAHLDLTCSGSVDKFFSEAQPTHVFLAACKKGGIQANQRFPADLMLNQFASPHKRD